MICQVVNPKLPVRSNYNQNIFNSGWGNPTHIKLDERLLNLPPPPPPHLTSLVLGKYAANFPQDSSKFCRCRLPQVWCWIRGKERRRSTWNYVLLSTIVTSQCGHCPTRVLLNHPPTHSSSRRMVFHQQFTKLPWKASPSGILNMRRTRALFYLCAP